MDSAFTTTANVDVGWRVRLDADEAALPSTGSCLRKTTLLACINSPIIPSLPSVATSELTQGSCLTVELLVGAERRVALDIRSPLEGGNFRGAHREARTG